MKILVIDDEAAVRYAITRILEKNGYEVTNAADGMRGMSQFHAWHPDLVITDLIMPEQEGMQTIKQLRQADPAVKILAISGGGRIVNVDFLQVARRIGADDILAKPFDSRELLAMVRRLVPDVRQCRVRGTRRAYGNGDTVTSVLRTTSLFRLGGDARYLRRALKFAEAAAFQQDGLRFQSGGGAVEKTRTSTGFPPQRPQRCASTNSATTACRHPRGRFRAPGHTPFGNGARA